MRFLSLPLIREFAGYIFDVDGTLIDSAVDICGAIQSVLAAAGRDDVQDAYLRRFIGRHLDDLWVEVFPGCSAEQMQDWLQQYRSHYQVRRHSGTTVYPGVRETLVALPGKKSTATTKSTQTTSAVLELMGLHQYFEHLQGTDGFPAKPNPDVLYKAGEGLGLPLSECLFIGDSPADMEAAQRAGIASCAVTWGYGALEEMNKWNPTYVIDNLLHLIPQPR